MNTSRHLVATLFGLALLAGGSIARADPPLLYQTPPPVAPEPGTPPLRPMAALLPPASHMHSPALFAGGTFLTLVGVASTIGGGYLFNGNIEQEMRWWVHAVGAALLLNGAGCLGSGIAMMVIGSRSLPGARSASVRPTVALSPAGASLRLSF